MTSSFSDSNLLATESRIPHSINRASSSVEESYDEDEGFCLVGLPSTSVDSLDGEMLPISMLYSAAEESILQQTHKIQSIDQQPQPHLLDKKGLLVQTSSPSWAHSYKLKESSRSEIMTYLHHRKERESHERGNNHKLLKIVVTFRELSLWTMTSTKPKIVTIGSSLYDQVTCGMLADKLERVDILKSVSGQLKPHKMTLLLGPPGCGRSLLMSLLSYRLNGSYLPAETHLSGQITFNGDPLPLNGLNDQCRFIPGKLIDYVEQHDNHAPLLTVEETLRYAWMCTAKHRNGEVDETEAKIAVHNMLTILGLTGCKDTLVGDESIRGISGGEKRRLTLGEMLITPRPVKMLDSITDGLDAATAYDILRYLRDACSVLGHTYMISLHQPSTAIYELFDEVIVMSEGQVIFQGSRSHAKPYFESLGFICPAGMEEVDIVQEMATVEGGRHFRSCHNGQVGDYNTKTISHSAFLAKRWQESSFYQSMMVNLDNVDSISLVHGKAENCNSPELFPWPESSSTNGVSKASWWFFLSITLQKYLTIEKRSKAFYLSRVIPTIILGVLVGSVYQGIGMTDVYTMTGFFFFHILVPATGQISMLPTYYAQKRSHYKFLDAMFYPSPSIFNIVQSVFAYPLFIIETIFACMSSYWIIGLSSDGYGSHFAFFVFVTFVLTLVMTKCFRFFAILCADNSNAVGMGGVVLLFWSLFSGFISPMNATPIYWQWFFYCNPCAWALTALSINEYSSSRYDKEMCIDLECNTKERFGNIALKQYGHSTQDGYKWFCVLILFVMYVVMIVALELLLRHKRSIASPAPPVRDSSTRLEPAIVVAESSLKTIKDIESISSPVIEMQFDSVTMTFRGVGYAVSGKEKGSELQLLSNVNGYFEPGTMTALMGSTGAGKTTLLDVLAGRKNQGTCLGDIKLNGKSMNDADVSFKSIIAYVEQFDALSAYSTPREAIRFSATLRLPSNTSDEILLSWVDTVVNMVELQDIEHRLIGNVHKGGMSFQQRKRVSIAIEFAANPSIMFLDEPTTGLDARSANIVIQNIRTIANSGRTIVCTIHQPSPCVFFAFDKLLLLQAGGKVAYFGDVGENGNCIVKYFETLPDSKPLEIGKNPATWMLECIGAGTKQRKQSEQKNQLSLEESKENVFIDYCDIFSNSECCKRQWSHLDLLIKKTYHTDDNRHLNTINGNTWTTWYLQFSMLFHRSWLSYWRNPGYNLTRILQNVFVSIAFASAYVQYQCETSSDVLAFVAVLLMTAISCSILAMLMAVAVSFNERLVFYREQQSNMYSVFIYTVVDILVEMPYIALASLALVGPFFFISGMDTVGDNPSANFFDYWLFSGLILAFNVFYGQFLAAALPDLSICQSLSASIFSLFSGFIIKTNSIPPFWRFAYWANPFHYALEGIVMTQFHHDGTIISLWDGAQTTVGSFIIQSFPDWHFNNLSYDILALVLFVLSNCMLRFLCLSFLRYEKR